MIVSASYKTDIPAFYGRWFMNRLDAGWCRMTNPYGGQVYRIALDAGSVSGIVFWTKNLGPFLDALAEIRRRGYAAVVQYGINDYPRALEQSVAGRDQCIAHMHGLARAAGPRAAVWRYDPVVVTSLTPAQWHEANFANLARALTGATDEVVISFAHIYRKTRRNMDAAAARHGFSWRDPDGGEKRSLARSLADIARGCGMRLTICAQPEYLSDGIEGAKCIDAGRLADVGQRPVAAAAGGNRPGCNCAASRDIGGYDTCPHGCAYCYAVQSPDLARRRFRAHDPDGEFISAPQAARGKPPA